jgi:hypothetical protein
MVEVPKPLGSTLMTPQRSAPRQRPAARSWAAPLGAPLEVQGDHPAP